MKKLPELSIFFPVYNDQHTISTLISNAYSVGYKYSKKLEVIAINDGSTDESARVLHELQHEFPHLRIITHTKNRGYGGALISGFKAAKKAWVFYTDSDGQYDVSELSKLVMQVTQSVDVVNGYKQLRSDNIFRKALGTFYNKILHCIYSIPIDDVDCDFRLIKRKFVPTKLFSSSGAICTELVLCMAKKGARFDEVAVNHYPRLHGRSQFITFKNLLTTLKDHIALYRRFH